MSTFPVLTSEQVAALSRMFRAGEGCWEWLSHKGRKGYGTLHFQGRTQRAHRFMYRLLSGPIPAGLDLDHLCRNPSCVRPDHLEPVSPTENQRRGLRGVLTTHCPQGHAYAGENLATNSKGHRICRTCRIDRCRAWREARRGTPS